MEAIIEKISQMTIGEIVGNSTLLLFALMSMVEFTPLKWNPLSSILKWLGKKVNATMYDQLAEQDKKLESLKNAMDDNEIDRIRWEILDFANSCQQGKKHTKDEFIHIVELNKKYHEILGRRGMTNGIIDLEYKNIVRIYEECLRKDSFL